MNNLPSELSGAKTWGPTPCPFCDNPDAILFFSPSNWIAMEGWAVYCISDPPLLRRHITSLSVLEGEVLSAAIETRNQYSRRIEK